jgi:xanthine dehydrogenase YagR molybdenum-binding subunit
MGVASAVRGALISKSAARVRLGRDGIVRVECDMTDIGTGSYTIISQVAAEMMGLPLNRVVTRLGDSDLPETYGSGWPTGRCILHRGRLRSLRQAARPGGAAVGLQRDATWTSLDGQVRSGGRAIPLADAAKYGELVAEDFMEYGDLAERYDRQTFGAHFVEVAVDRYTGVIRIRRMLAVCAAGRILNPLTARSQVIGGMTMGIGAALMEELAVDTRYGFFVNHDLAGYEVPVHADVPHLDVVFIDEVDPTMSPLKAKGVGELGLTGVAAAIANAVYNATGVRVRDYPLTLEKHLTQLSIA